ncbi:hypothetical protein BsWGS_27078 [Bradybaena similaris]
MDSASRAATLAVFAFLACLRIDATTASLSTSDLMKSKVVSNIIRIAEEIHDDLRTTPPSYNDREPAKIQVMLYVSSIDAVNEFSMDFTVSILLHLKWQENRINYVMAANYFNESRQHFVDFDSENIKKVWVPDIFFPNEKKGSFHVIMTENRMMRFYKGGTMLYISRLSLTLSCPMDLTNYPFDKQICHLLIMSFGYSDKDITLEWTNSTEPSLVVDQKGSSILLDDQLVLPQFEVKQVVARDCDKRYHQKMGNHSCLQAEFHMSRNVWFYMVQMYVPSILIVMLSWISFWLTVNSVPGRISLGLLTVLTMTTQSSSVNASLPRVSYTKAIDVWMSTCLVFVFAALLEFAIVNVLSRNVSSRGFSLKHVFAIPKELDGGETSPAAEVTHPIDGLVDSEGHKKPCDKTGVVYAMYLDMSARILFPTCFTIFLVTYWSYYVNT